MATPAHPDVIVYLCKNCIPGGRYAPVQWTDAGLHIRVKEMPCSGKIDAQYMLHALEGGLLGVCVVTCPHGDCTLAQGNYRAEVQGPHRAAPARRNRPGPRSRPAHKLSS